MGVSLGESGGLDWGKSWLTALFLREKRKNEDFVNYFISYRLPDYTDSSAHSYGFMPIQHRKRREVWAFCGRFQRIRTGIACKFEGK